MAFKGGSKARRREEIAGALLREISQSHSNPAKQFISDEEQLRKIWEDDSIRYFVKPQYLVDVREKFLKILSILVLVEWPFRDNEFGKLFVDAGPERLSDTRLPANPEELRFLDKYADTFWYKQFIFLPICIEDDYNAVQIIERAFPYRWPYLSEGAKVGEGAFGQVSEVTVAKGAIKTTNSEGRRSFNHEVR